MFKSEHDLRTRQRGPIRQTHVIRLLAAAASSRRGAGADRGDRDGGRRQFS
jgi:hypothetical protein